ncbi:MAG TPA: hypothetical protein VFA26_22135 [Gemmataceae bacterium]|nr:hypothetical protein [Gemmataceae bacterium]
MGDSGSRITELEIGAVGQQPGEIAVAPDLEAAVIGPVGEIQVDLLLAVDKAQFSIEAQNGSSDPFFGPPLQPPSLVINMDAKTFLGIVKFIGRTQRTSSYATVYNDGTGVLLLKDSKHNGTKRWETKNPNGGNTNLKALFDFKKTLWPLCSRTSP